ncbi:MAG TPA: hypothetical protein VGM70_10025 [Pseudolysinimonas sp.]|jgi:putative hemolysin
MKPLLARIAGGAGLAATIVLLSACTGGASAPETRTPTPSGSGTPSAAFDTAAAEAYCTGHGGQLQERQPMFNTNADQSQWVTIGSPVVACRFQSTDADASRIYVDLVTLYDTNPTLAALAYLSKTPIPSGATGNPATALCTVLGGASTFGPGADGGGLVNTQDPDDVVFSPCTFADGSFIEEWGIAYYADGTIRGTDLTKLFRFDESKLPAVFNH